MLLLGEWFPSSDGTILPVLKGGVLAANGKWISEHFLVDSGADVTVLSPAVHRELRLPTNGVNGQLGGIGGVTGVTFVSTHIRSQRHDGGTAVFRGNYHTLAAAQHMEISVLGRDIIDMFALIVDRPGNVVCLLREKHSYEIKEPT